MLPTAMRYCVRSVTTACPAPHTPVRVRLRVPSPMCAPRRRAAFMGCPRAPRARARRARCRTRGAAAGCGAGAGRPRRAHLRVHLAQAAEERDGQACPAGRVALHQRRQLVVVADQAERARAQQRRQYRRQRQLPGLVDQAHVEHAPAQHRVLRAQARAGHLCARARGSGRRPRRRAAPPALRPRALRGAAAVGALSRVRKWLKWAAQVVRQNRAAVLARQGRRAGGARATLAVSARWRQAATEAPGFSAPPGR